MAAGEGRAPCRAARRGGCARRPATKNERSRPPARSSCAARPDSARRSRPRRAAGPASGARVLEQAPHRRGRPRPAAGAKAASGLARPRRCARGRRRRTPPGGRARRGAKKRPRRRLARRERRGRRPDHRAGDLVLEPLAGQVEAGRRCGRCRGRPGRGAASRRWRRRRRPRGSRGRPTGGPCPGRGSAGSSPPGRSADAGRRGGRCTARRRPRCSSRSRARPSPTSWTRVASQASGLGAAVLVTSTRHSQSGALRMQPERRRACRTPSAAPSQTKRSSAAATSTRAPGPTTSTTRPRRADAQEQPADAAVEGRAVDLVDERAPARAPWCSMAKRQPLGRTLIERPGARWRCGAGRGRPPAASRRCGWLSSLLSRGRVRTPAERYLGGQGKPDGLLRESASFGVVSPGMHREAWP